MDTATAALAAQFEALVAHELQTTTATMTGLQTQVAALAQVLRAAQAATDSAAAATQAAAAATQAATAAATAAIARANAAADARVATAEARATAAEAQAMEATARANAAEMALTAATAAPTVVAPSLNVYTGDVSIRNEDNLLKFTPLLSGAWKIEGNVDIWGPAITEARLLLLFGSVQEIVGNLSISEANNLFRLEGLHNLTNIGGSLLTLGNSSLVSFEGLHNVTSIGGGLGIYSNPNLISVEGLRSLTSIRGTSSGYAIVIQSNRALARGLPFPALTRKAGPVHPANDGNAHLKANITALESVPTF
jgi:hypothetical protein